MWNLASSVPIVVAVPSAEHRPVWEDGHRRMVQHRGWVDEFTDGVVTHEKDERSGWHV
jgi:hypothetical protein